MQETSRARVAEGSPGDGISRDTVKQQALTERQVPQRGGQPGGCWAGMPTHHAQVSGLLCHLPRQQCPGQEFQNQKRKGHLKLHGGLEDRVRG